MWLASFDSPAPPNSVAGANVQNYLSFSFGQDKQKPKKCGLQESVSYEDLLNDPARKKPQKPERVVDQGETVHCTEQTVAIFLSELVRAQITLIGISPQNARSSTADRGWR